MENKNEIVDNWLPRYTGTALENFGKYILLTNFQNYVTLFAEREKVDVKGMDKTMPNATSGNRLS
jgi:AMP nucleosidase